MTVDDMAVAVVVGAADVAIVDLFVVVVDDVTVLLLSMLSWSLARAARGTNRRMTVALLRRTEASRSPM